MNPPLPSDDTTPGEKQPVKTSEISAEQGAKTTPTGDFLAGGNWGDRLGM